MLESVMVRVLQHYPDQAVWQMAAVVHSTVSKRSKRCLNIFSKTKVSFRLPVALQSSDPRYCATVYLYLRHCEGSICRRAHGQANA